jgi:Fe-S cluster assembly protein SufD
MSEALLSNINKSPVRTWRWLGVNDTTIEGAIPEIKEYNKDAVQKVENSAADIFSNKNMPVYPLIFEDHNVLYGVSEDIITLVKKKYNTGVFIRGKAGEVSGDPIIIEYKSDSDNNVILDNNMVIAEENSKLTILINYSSSGEEEVFHNGLTRIFASKGSEVTVIKVQLFSEGSRHLDSNLAIVEEGAKVNLVAVELGSKNSAVSYVTELKGKSSEGNLSSIYLGDKDRTIDLNYVMNHYGKKTLSNIEVKGALLDKSKKIFRGTLDFKRGAAGAVGSEEEYAVLLSPNVRNRAVPLLLCSEEDVQGAHAASSGKVDEEMLFYIMSRGFSEAEAKKLVIEAAFNPVLEKIPVEAVKVAINEFISNRLK